MVDPSVSTATSRRIIAWRLAMARMPTASVTVTTAGSPSGTAETAAATTIRKMSMGGSPRYRPASASRAQMPGTMNSMTRPKRSTLRCSGVFSCGTFWIAAAMRPISVCMPVAAASAVARPLVTTVPM